MCSDNAKEVVVVSWMSGSVGIRLADLDALG